MLNLAIPTSIAILFTQYGLLGLFLNGLLSSVVPIPTELTISALLVSGQNQLNVFIVLTVASIIGGLLAYYLGYTGKKLSVQIRKHRSEGTDSSNISNTDTNHRTDKEKRSSVMLDRYGWIIIFLSPWIPIFGDVIPIIAGVKKYDFKKFIIVMSIGKTVKAVAIVYFLAIIVSSIFHQS
ncbi:MAG TPA: VTT domain-containing protein [Nitrososphaeraceae archaeon]|jgi:membrane protein YqaA with SNARE-associated domain